MGEARQARVIWEETAETLTLQGEPVLKYTLSWPRIEDGGLGGGKSWPLERSRKP